MNTASLHVFRYNGLPANLARHGFTQTGEGVTLTEKEARYLMATGSTEFTATGRVTGEHTKFTKAEMDAAEEDSTGANAAMEDAAATSTDDSGPCWPVQSPEDSTVSDRNYTETMMEVVPQAAPEVSAHKAKATPRRRVR